MLDRIKHEPAILIGLVISIIAVIVQVIQGDLQWEAAIPLVSGIITRFFVTPTPTT